MPREFSLLIKPAGAECNLDCRYCFYKRALDLYSDEKSGAAPSEGRPAPKIMPDEVLREMCRKYMRCGLVRLGFSWQGGEPMLCGLDFYKKAVAWQTEFGFSGQTVTNALQTNGVLMNEDWARFLREYRFLVGLSLDGPEEIHDYYRKDYAGGGTFAKVMRAAEIMNRFGVQFNTLTLLTDRNVNQPVELYDFFTRQSFRHLQFIAPLEVDPQTREVRDFNITAAQYAKFLCDLFDVWYERGFPDVSIREFDSVLSYYVDGVSLICPFQKECGAYIVIERNGDAYPCDFFVFSEWKMGNIAQRHFSDIFANPKYDEFKRLKTQMNPACAECKWLPLCYGDCTKYRVFQDGDPRRLSYYCLAMRTFFEHSEERFRKLASRVKEFRARNTPPGRPPARGARI